jgi:hypothetical protein
MKDSWAKARTLCSAVMVVMAWVLWVKYEETLPPQYRPRHSWTPEAGYPDDGYGQCVADARTLATRGRRRSEDPSVRGLETPGLSGPGGQPHGVRLRRTARAPRPPRLDGTLTTQLEALIQQYPTFGYRRLWTWLRFREGCRVTPCTFPHSSQRNARTKRGTRPRATRRRSACPFRIGVRQ